MNGRKRFILLLGILAIVAIGTGAITLKVLYEAAFEEEKERLVETAKSQARMIEAVARFDKRYSQNDVPGGAQAATLGQLREAHENFKGFGETGEFTLAKLEGDSIIFLLSHRHHDLDNPKPVPFTGKNAEPMRRALSGLCGTVTGLDYRGEMVVAAYEPVAELNMGIVAKIDLAEIQAPFVRAGILAGCGAALLVILGAILFLRVGMPLIQRLEESEKKYRQLFSAESDAILIFDAVTLQCLDANPAALELYGYNLDEFLDLKVQDISAESDESRATITSVSNSETENIVYRMHRKKNGEVFPAEISRGSFMLGEREIICGIIRDITERKEVEKALKESEAKYRAIIDFALYPIVLIDIETGRFVQFNSEAHNTLGYSRDEFQELTLTDVDASESPEEVAEHIETVLRVGSDKFETRMRTKSGEFKDVLVSVASISLQGRQYLSSMWRDITAQKQANLVRRQQHEFLQTVIDSLGHPLSVISTTDYSIKLANAACKSLEGYKDGITCHHLFHRSRVPCGGTTQPCPVSRVVETGESATVEHQHIDHDGKPTYSQISVFPIFDSENNVSEIIEYVVDITERKLAEVALRNSEERVRSIIEQAGDAFYLLNTKGRFIEVNQRACETLGYTRDELLKLAVSDIDPNFPRDGLAEIIQSLQPGKPQTLETIHRRHDGSTFPVEIRMALIEFHGDTRLLVLGRDISERKVSEAALTASLKEKETLLKEIHHRVKNNLQVISSLLRIQSDHTDDDEVISVLKASQGRVNSMALIHEQLYQSSNLAEIDFTEYIDNLAERMMASYGVNTKKITFENSLENLFLSIDTAIPCGLIVTELLSNVLKHAFPDGKTGRIVISHSSDGNQCALTVSDSGVGIPPEVDIENSPSLGLQLVGLLAKQLGGSIEMTSDKGTRVSLVYPRETTSTDDSPNRVEVLEKA